MSYNFCHFRVVKYTNMNAENEYNIRLGKYLDDPDSYEAEPKKWKPVEAVEIWAVSSVC